MKRLPSRVAACTLRVRPGAAWVRILPAGEFDAPRGALAGAGPWHLSPAAAAAIIARNRTRTADIAVDFEHQTLLAPENGQPAPAAGWIDPRSLQFIGDGEDPGLYGRVSWVGDTAALIAADRYRYLSPVFSVGNEGEPLDVLHVALTNFPAIDAPLGAALAARVPPENHPQAQQESTVDMPNDAQNLMQELIELLGLPSDSQILADLAEHAAQAIVRELAQDVEQPARGICGVGGNCEHQKPLFLYTCLTASCIAHRT